jgi:hypothetical protein
MADLLQLKCSQARRVPAWLLFGKRPPIGNDDLISIAKHGFTHLYKNKGLIEIFGSLTGQSP